MITMFQTNLSYPPISSLFCSVIITLIFMYSFLETRAANTGDFSFDTLSQSEKQSLYEETIVRRDLNLDYWDADTLTYYLGYDNKKKNIFLEENASKNLKGSKEYAGIDAAVMFYAQWCRNCHTFVPIWDTIASLLHAGTTRGNIVMALFDCEMNEQHMKICNVAGVEKYPTLMYLGASSCYEPNSLWELLLGRREKYTPNIVDYKLSRAVTFQGDLNVGDSVLDWVKVMRALSSWHKLSNNKGAWMRSFRKSLWNILNLGILKNMIRTKIPTNLSYLPIGIPYYRRNTSFFPMAVKWELNMLENKIKSSETDLESYKLASKNGDLFIESFLFPPQVNISFEYNSMDKNINKTQSEVNVTTTNADPFKIMSETMAWDIKSDIFIFPQKKNYEAIILKSCLIDIITDYCNRLFTRVTSQFVFALKSFSIDEYPNIVEIEDKIRGSVKEKEPYCSIFHSCLITDFKGEENELMMTCRPSMCPFINTNACTYVSGCLSEGIRGEYSDVLNKWNIHKSENITNITLTP